MRKLRTLQMLAGLTTSRAERVVERQIRRFRRQVAEHEQAMLLVDRIKQREAGADGMRPMPFARKP